MEGIERLGGDFRLERGHVETSLEQLTKNMDGMKLSKVQDRMRDYVTQVDNRENQLEGMRYFRRMLCEENNPHVQHIINIGLVPHFVQALKADACPELQLEAAWALTNVSAGTTEETSVVVEQGGMTILVDLMKSKQSNLREQAIWAVGNIAAEGKFRDSLIENNALQLLLDTLTTEHIELSTQRIGTWALANFVRHKLRSLDPEVKKEEFLQLLCVVKDLLNAQDHEVVLDAAWGLSSLAAWGNHAIDSLFESCALDYLVLLLEQETASTILIPVLKTFSIIASTSSQYVDFLLGYDGLLSRMQHLLDPPFTSRVVYNALSFVRNVAEKDYKQVRELVNAKMLPKLIRFIGRGTSDQRQLAAHALVDIFTTKDMPQGAWGCLISEDEICALCDMLTWNGKSSVQMALKSLSMALHAAERYIPAGKDHCFLNESYAVAANMSQRKKRVRVRDKQRTGQAMPKVNVVAEIIRSHDSYFTLYHLQEHENESISDSATNIVSKYFQEDILHDPDMNDENESDQQFLLDYKETFLDEREEDMIDVCSSFSKAVLHEDSLEPTEIITK